MAGLPAACVIPPPGDFAESDAGASSPPVVVSVTPPEFAPPTMIVDVPNEQRRLGLELRDVDLDDTLYVRIYVDYGKPVPVNFAASCTAVPTGAENRPADCSAATLCGLISDGETHLIEVMVADREFLDEGDPGPFRSLPETAAYSIRGWEMVCSQ